MWFNKLSAHLHQSMLPFIPILLFWQKICKTISCFPPISQDLKNWSQVKLEQLQGYVQSLRSCTDYGRVGSLLQHIPQVLSEAKLILIHLMSLQVF